MSGATGAGAGPAGAEGYAQPDPPPGPDGTGGHGGRRGRRRAASGPEADPQAHAYTYDGAPEGPMPPPTAAPTAPPTPHHPPQAYTPPAGMAADGAGPHTAMRGAQPYEQGPGPAMQGQGQAQQTAAGVRRSRTGARTVPRTRKARLRIAKADPWSVMKVSFLLSIALGICTIVAVTVLWMVLDAMGVFSTVGGTISEATGSDDSEGFDLESFLSLPRVAGFTAVVALIDVVLATALATLGAFIYNLSAGFVGGIEVTLAEDE